MSARFFFADAITVVCFWLYNAKHDRAEMRAQQASQATAVNPVSTASQSDPEQDPPHEASSVVYELPTSKDTGDLAMEWGVWVDYERITEHGDPSQIEGRLPALMAESKKNCRHADARCMCAGHLVS